MPFKLNKHHILLHFIVFLWGFSPILGRFITASAFQLVWYRIIFTLLILTCYILFTKKSINIKTQDLGKFAGIGILISLHWVCFYHTIKISNVSITLATFSTVTFFTGLLEPLFFNRKIKLYEMFLGVIIILAVWLILSVEMFYWKAILLGILAAFLSSVFSVLNGLMIKKHSPITITYIELWFGLIGLSFFLLLDGVFTTEFFSLSTADFGGLFLLAAFCTAFPFLTSVKLMNYISPYTISLTMNLETVYGILLAILIYQEHKELSWHFYSGLIIILLSLLINGFMKMRMKKNSSN